MDNWWCAVAPSRPCRSRLVCSTLCRTRCVSFSKTSRLRNARPFASPLARRRWVHKASDHMSLHRPLAAAGLEFQSTARVPAGVTPLRSSSSLRLGVQSVCFSEIDTLNPQPQTGTRGTEIAGVFEQMLSQSGVCPDVEPMDEISMVAGFSTSAFIHFLSSLDDGCSTKVTTDCTARPNRVRADFATARDMKSRNRQYTYLTITMGSPD